MINVVLPWPPSANKYWRNINGRTLVSKEAKQYKLLVKGLAYTWKATQMRGRVQLAIGAYPPDNRARDLDNLLKITIDSLTETGLFVNDSQIDRISITRLMVRKPGYLNILISEIGENA